MSNEWHPTQAKGRDSVSASENSRKSYSAKFVDTFGGLFHFRDELASAILSGQEFYVLLDELDSDERRIYRSTHGLGAFMPDNSIDSGALKRREEIEHKLALLLRDRHSREPDVYKLNYQDVHHSHGRFEGIDRKEVMKALMDIHFSYYVSTYTWNEVICNDGKWGIVISDVDKIRVGAIRKRYAHVLGKPVFVIASSLIQSVRGVVGEFSVFSRNGSTLHFSGEDVWATFYD